MGLPRVSALPKASPDLRQIPDLLQINAMMDGVATFAVW